MTMTHFNKSLYTPEAASSFKEEIGQPTMTASSSYNIVASTTNEKNKILNSGTPFKTQTVTEKDLDLHITVSSTR